MPATDVPSMAEYHWPTKSLKRKAEDQFIPSLGGPHKRMINRWESRVPPGFRTTNKTKERKDAKIGEDGEDENEGDGKSEEEEEEEGDQGEEEVAAGTDSSELLAKSTDDSDEQINHVVEKVMDAPNAQDSQAGHFRFLLHDDQNQKVETTMILPDKRSFSGQFRHLDGTIEVMGGDAQIKEAAKAFVERQQSSSTLARAYTGDDLELDMLPSKMPV